MRHPTRCPGCDRTLNIPVGGLGKKVRCPACRTVFIAAAEDDIAEVLPVDAPRRPGRHSRLPVPLLIVLIAGGIGFLCIAGAALVAVLLWHRGWAEQTWQQVGSPEAAFRASMPGAPTEEHEPQDTPAGPVETHKFALVRGSKKQLFQVVSISFPEAVFKSLGTEKLLSLGRDDATAASKGGKLLSEHPIQLGSHPGLEVKFSVSEVGFVTTRVYVGAHRIYLVIVGLPEDNFATPDAVQFFDSFTILDETGPDGAPGSSGGVTELASFIPHNGGVAVPVAVTPDGQMLVTAGDGVLKTWNASGGQLWDTIALPPGVSAVSQMAFSPNGESLGLAGFWYGVMRGSGHSLAPPKVMQAMNACRVAFAPDGTMLAVGTNQGEVILYQLNSGAEQRWVNSRHVTIAGLAFSRDGQRLAVVAESDKRVTLYRVPTLTEEGVLDGHTNGLSGVVFLPDGKTLATASYDKTIKLWNVDEQREIATLEGHTAILRCLAGSPDGRLLASGSGDATILLWDVAQRKPVAELKTPPHEVCAVAFGGNSILAAACAGGPVKVWNVSRLGAK
jgi:WD40 repeat protein